MACDGAWGVSAFLSATCSSGVCLLAVFHSFSRTELMFGTAQLQKAPSQGKSRSRAASCCPGGPVSCALYRVFGVEGGWESAVVLPHLKFTGLKNKICCNYSLWLREIHICIYIPIKTWIQVVFFFVCLFFNENLSFIKLSSKILRLHKNSTAEKFTKYSVH